MPLDPRVEILVVANQYRKPLIEPHVRAHRHEIFTNDYDPPPGWEPKKEFNGYTKNHFNGYRAFRGHQEAWRALSTPIGLAFEDDAVPNRKDWIEIVNFSVELLHKFELVALHGRQHNKNCFDSMPVPEFKTNVLVPIKPGSWMVGCLAYMMAEETSQRLLNYKPDGLPIDIFLFQRFKLALIDPSPFNHDMSQKSLMDK